MSCNILIKNAILSADSKHFRDAWFYCPCLILCWLLLAFFFPAPVNALEGDAYITWGVELEDASDEINRYLNERVQTAISDINYRIDTEITPRMGRKQKKPRYKHPSNYNCSDVAVQVMQIFRRPFVQLIESWVANHPEIEVYPPWGDMSTWLFYQNSIYEKSVLPPYLPMSRTVNINGIYFSTDKLGHFVSFGTKFYLRYQRLREQGESEQQALDAIILWGIDSENYLVGKMWTGVFSHGDLEANFQGFRFVKQFCDTSDSPYLIQRQGHWVLEGEVSIEPFVTPGFDEAYNTSAFSTLQWSNVRRNLVDKGYCEKWRSEPVRAMYRHYDTFEKSYAYQFTRELMGSGTIVDNAQFNIERACE